MLRKAQVDREKVENRLDEVVDKKNYCMWRVESLNTDLEHTEIAKQRKTNGEEYVALTTFIE